MLFLINDILDLERVESGRLELDRQPTSLRAVLEGAMEAVAALAAQHGITIERHDGHGLVLGDRDRLVQVVVNLLCNAVKFSPGGGRVSLDARREGGSIRVEVRDEGRGVPPGFRELIFEPFRQVESDDARVRGGTGLGLSICRAIVEQHGGAIGVAGREGPGATFWFTSARGRSRGGPGERVETVRILIVDDEDDIRTIARLSLERLGGMTVIEARSGREALAAAARERPEAVLLDVMMPEMDGADTLAAPRRDEATAGIPVLFLTAKALPGEVERLKGLGAAAVLTKPFDPSALAGQLREALAALRQGGAPPARGPRFGVRRAAPGRIEPRPRGNVDGRSNHGERGVLSEHRDGAAAGRRSRRTGPDVLPAGGTMQVGFVAFDADVSAPEEAHAAQWIAVLEGEVELTTGGATAVYRKGDAYFIPAGVPHAARIKKGSRLLDVFDQVDRFRSR